MAMLDKVSDAYKEYLQTIDYSRSVQARKNGTTYYIRDNGNSIKAFPVALDSSNKKEIKECLDRGISRYLRSEWAIAYSTIDGIRSITDRYRNILVLEGPPCITVSQNGTVEKYVVLQKDWDNPIVLNGLNTSFPKLKELGTAKGEVFHVTLFSHSLGPDAGDFYAWRENNTLCMFGIQKENRNSKIIQNDTLTAGNIYSPRNIYTRINIPLNNIRYYKAEGSLHYEQQVSGGGGGGVNYKGAVVGGLLFGGVGAMIGSRANTEAEKISTTTVKVDERVCAVTLFDEEFGRNIFAFHADDIEVFDWLIPEKGYDYVIEKRRREMDELS